MTFAPETICLADGREVPASAVEALNQLEKKWPGATLEQARPAITAALLAVTPDHCPNCFASLSEDD